MVSGPGEAERALDALTAKYARHRTVVHAWRADPPVMAAIELITDAS